MWGSTKLNCIKMLLQSYTIFYLLYAWPMSSITTHFWWLQCLNFWPFFCTKLRKKREKKVSRRSWRAGSREEKHQWGLSSEAVWLLLSVSSLAAFTTCRYTSLSSFNGRLRGDLSGAELLLSAGDSYDARRAIHCSGARYYKICSAVHWRLGAAALFPA